MNNMLETKMFGITFNNPVFSASGTFGYGRDYEDYVKPHELGAVVTKGTAIKEWIGNPPPRVYETASGMLNSIGLQNPGIDYFLEHDLPFLKNQNAKVIINVVGHTQKEYEDVVKKCQNRKGIHALEINISCPNVTEGGMAFGTDPEVAYKLLKSLRSISNLPLIAKLSPNVTDITEIAKACQESGIDSISLINTLSGIAIDIGTQKPVLGNIYGGLSGPAIKPVALKMVYQVSQAVNLPIIGIGGIANGKDAIEFFLAGASAVQVGTSIFIDPQIHKKIIHEIKDYLDKNSYKNISEIVGLAWKEINMENSLRERLILALDVDTENEALEIVKELHDLIGYFKIGMQLYYSTGNSLIEKYMSLEEVFLDLKLHDIPNTVQNGARVLANLGVEMTNFHATGGPQMLKSASAGLKESNAEITPIGIAVTILTSLSKDDLEKIGIKDNVKESVKQLAIMTKEAGLKGVVCSPQEIEIVKKACGEEFLTITPGIRPTWSVKNDQKRITTPYQAMKDGGDYLVIGRPIRNAEDRREAAGLVLEEMENGLNEYLKGRS